MPETPTPTTDTFDHNAQIVLGFSAALFVLIVGGVHVLRFLG